MKKEMMKEKVIHPNRELLGFLMQVTQIKRKWNLCQINAI